MKKLSIVGKKIVGKNDLLDKLFLSDEEAQKLLCKCNHSWKHHKRYFRKIHGQSWAKEGYVCKKCDCKNIKKIKEVVE